MYIWPYWSSEVQESWPYDPMHYYKLIHISSTPKKHESGKSRLEIWVFVCYNLEHVDQENDAAEQEKKN